MLLQSLRRRVLIADGNRDVADSLALRLQMDGHDVTVVTDGASALRAIENGQPDVVMLDIGMPHLNGYDVALRVRSQRPNDITLIAVTGWGTEADNANVAAAGFEHHFAQPIDPDELSSLLRALAKR